MGTFAKHENSFKAEEIPAEGTATIDKQFRQVFAIKFDRKIQVSFFPSCNFGRAHSKTRNKAIYIKRPAKQYFGETGEFRTIISSIPN